MQRPGHVLHAQAPAVCMLHEHARTQTHAPAPRDDDIGVLAARRDIRVERRLDKLGVLLNHARNVAPAVADVALDAVVGLHVSQRVAACQCVHEMMHHVRIRSVPGRAQRRSRCSVQVRLQSTHMLIRRHTAQPSRSALPRTRPVPAREPHVVVGVDVHRHVQQVPDLGHVQHEDALHDDDVRGVDAPRLVRARVPREIVDRDLDGLHRLSSSDDGGGAPHNVACATPASRSGARGVLFE